MKTYTTKIAKNGATLYYSTETGKRIAKETALENERNYILTNGTVKERYELAKENFRFNERGEVERLWFHDVVSYGNRYNFKVTTKYEWYVVSDKDADYALQKYCRMTLAEFRAEVEVETEENVEVEETTTEQVAEVSTMNAVEKLAEIKAEQDKINDAQVYYYTTNRGNVYTARYGETGSTPRGKWYTCHEIAGLSEQNVISLATETESGEFVNMLCKFIATETDGSEDDADINEVFSLLPAVDSLRDVEPTVEDLLPELDELKNEIDTVNDKFLRVSFAIDTCKHFFLNKACDPFFLFRHEYNKEADTIIKASVRLYDKCIAIDFDKTFEHLSTFQYIDHGIRNETYHKAWEIFEAIRDNLGDQALASELTKLADEFGIDRALLLQSDDCKFNPALFDEKPTEPAPEPTGKMKWAAELLDNYTYEFEGDWEAGNGGLARHYKRFNRYGEQVGKLVEVFTDKTSFILDHVNIVVKSIRTYYYINGEQLSYLNGEFNFIWSDKYKAGMNMVGGEHLQVEVPDGQWKKYKNFMVNKDEFFKIMSERGACTIAEENRKLDEAFTESESPATFKVGKTYLAEMRRAGDEASFKILSRSAKFVTAMPVALAEWGETKADNDYVFQRRIYRDDFGDEYFMEPDNQIAVRARKAYQFDEPEVPMVVEPAKPPVDTFTAKRDRLIAERDAANAKLKEAEEVFKAAKLAAFNADDAVMGFMEDAVDEMRERIDLPDEVLEVKTMKDSLKRAMKIALERHEGFVKLGQMTAAENEMKLYAICRNALAALK